MGPFRSLCIAVLLTFSFCSSAWSQEPRAANSRQKIILDTDIGGDIDDAFALAFVLASSEFEVLGITTAWGDTQLRARLVDRMLCETGMSNIPVMAGIPAEQAGGQLSQARWAEAFPKPSKPYGSGVDFILEQIRRYPNEITLLAIAPMSNVGALIERDPETFKKLKRVVIMGGSIYRGYGDLGYLPNRGPDPEYNIKSDVPSARRLFASAVPLFVMPLDSTQLKLDEVKREVIFQQITPLTDALTLLYHLWGQQTPTLFDPVAVAFTMRPDVCPTKPMHIDIDDKGYTRPGAGSPNVQVCLNSKSDEFFDLFMSRLLNQKLAGKCKR
ncbi:MAG: nucleoside hydrolase [Acidobacteria bacterium]|nr:MAG: nucleoside hydrolase [Acidobacteriota bacterium]